MCFIKTTMSTIHRTSPHFVLSSHVLVRGKYIALFYLVHKLLNEILIIKRNKIIFSFGEYDYWTLVKMWKTYGLSFSNPSFVQLKKNFEFLSLLFKV